MLALRHTWATIAVKAGVPIEVVAQALGHTDIRITYERYVMRSVDIFRTAQRKFADAVLKAVSPDAVLARWNTSPVLVA